jgi:hypothetical protein
MDSCKLEIAAGMAVAVVEKLGTLMFVRFQSKRRSLLNSVVVLGLAALRKQIVDGPSKS